MRGRKSSVFLKEQNEVELPTATRPLSYSSHCDSSLLLTLTTWLHEGLSQIVTWSVLPCHGRQEAYVPAFPVITGREELLLRISRCLCVVLCACVVVQVCVLVHILYLTSASLLNRRNQQRKKFLAQVHRSFTGSYTLPAAQLLKIHFLQMRQWSLIIMDISLVTCSD